MTATYKLQCYSWLLIMYRKLAIQKSESKLFPKLSQACQNDSVNYNINCNTQID